MISNTQINASENGNIETTQQSLIRSPTSPQVIPIKVQFRIVEITK